MARPSSARGTPHSLAPKSSPHSIQQIRLKRNVRFGGRRTTIVLEPYVWESIDVVLTREQQSLDEFFRPDTSTPLTRSPVRRLKIFINIENMHAIEAIDKKLLVNMWYI